MSPNDTAGHIDKNAFIISTAILLGCCLIGVLVHFYIRIAVQKHVGIDDGFLVFGFCCLIASFTILLVTLDNMYLGEAFITVSSKDPGQVVDLPSDFLQRIFSFKRLITAQGMLSWLAILSVKFSFLFLFRKLIVRMKRMIRYWWFVVIFNIGVLGYGLAVYYIGCPYYNSFKGIECTSGPGVRRLVGHSVGSMVVDIVGDLLILAIPCYLIYKIKVGPRQKLALISSLCLTIFMAFATIIRVAGIRYKGGSALDTVWTVYWQMIEAEIGIFMASATAFRTLFVARGDEEVKQARAEKPIWSGRGNRARKPVMWWSKLSKDSTWGNSDSRAMTSGTGEADRHNSLPSDASPSGIGEPDRIDGQGREREEENNNTRMTV